MGNDGGSIPKRGELVKSAARTPTVSELKATAQESMTHAWNTCALTGDPLDKENCVSDWRGRLYNYESVLRSLIPSANDDTADKDDDDEGTETQAAAPVQRLRDVVRLRLLPAKGKKNVWICPLSLKELGNAKTPAVYMVPCGHVFDKAAVRRVTGDEELAACLECSAPVQNRDVIPILPTTEAEVRMLMARRDELVANGLSHSLKKDKMAMKNGKKRKIGEEAGGAGVEGEENGKEKKKTKKERKGRKDARLDGINNSATANLTAKVLAEQDELARRRKLAAAKA